MSATRYESPRSKHYDKYTYSTKRTVDRGTPYYVSEAHRDPRHTILNPLRLNQFGFATAEDGHLHCRIVSPARFGVAPIVVETSAGEDGGNNYCPGAVQLALVPPATPWEIFQADAGVSAKQCALMPLHLVVDRCVDRLKMTPLEIAKVEMEWKAAHLELTNSSPSKRRAKSPSVVLKRASSPSATSVGRNRRRDSSIAGSAATRAKSPSTKGTHYPAPALSQTNGQQPYSNGTATLRNCDHPNCEMYYMEDEYPRRTPLDPKEHPRNQGPPPIAKKVKGSHAIFNEKLAWSARPKIDTGAKK